MTNNLVVEGIASSLVREYLSRKGLKSTLKVMDEEMPRSENTINNRQTLVKMLQIEKLMKKNKEEEYSFRAMLEVIVKFWLQEWATTCDQTSFSQNKCSPCLVTKVSPKVKNEDLKIEESCDGETIAGMGMSALLSQHKIARETSTGFSLPQNHPKFSKHRGLASPVTYNIQEQQHQKCRQRSNHLKKLGSISGLIEDETDIARWRVSSDLTLPSGSNETLANLSKLDSTSCRKKGQSTGNNIFSVADSDNGYEEVKPKDATKGFLSMGESREDMRPSHGKNEKIQASDTVSADLNYEINKCNLNRDYVRSRENNQRKSKANLMKGDDLELAEVEVISELADLELTPAKTLSLHQYLQGTPIDLETAVKLKTLILGSANSMFNTEWQFQNLGFCSLLKLQYGIIQKRGGPCGLLAAIQASFLLEMLFGDNKLSSESCLEPSSQDCSYYLGLALSRIFWQAGEQERAIVTLSSGKSQFVGRNHCKADNITERLMLFEFTKYKDLVSFLNSNIHQFESDGTSGVILALYSAILSRTIEKVKNDMDEPKSKLIGAHGYCSQEMVNLFLVGQAVSNVFNDDVRLDGENGRATILKGLRSRSNIGFLSLFEHYRTCQVGSYYKTPRFPIWIVCSESHFTTLFSLCRDLVNDWKVERKFDLYYYDGLARQQNEIRLTVDTRSRGYKLPAHDDLIPPLELCIQTKWKDCYVDWNDTEPLL